MLPHFPENSGSPSKSSLRVRLKLVVAGASQPVQAQLVARRHIHRVRSADGVHGEVDRNVVLRRLLDCLGPSTTRISRLPVASSRYHVQSNCGRHALEEPEHTEKIQGETKGLARSAALNAAWPWCFYAQLKSRYIPKNYRHQQFIESVRSGECPAPR